MAIAEKQLHLYLVSDASGETVSAVGEAAYKRFLTLKTTEYLWPLVRSKERVDELIVAIQQRSGIVLHSMIDNDIRRYLIDQCELYQIQQICPIERVVSLISSYVMLHPDKNSPGKYTALNEDYFKKIESVNFAINHDDGQNVEDYNDADILILGVSRASKSPTSFYLAYRGYKVANLPIVNHGNYDYLSSINKPLIVGFTMSLQRLLEIRKSRCFEYAKASSVGSLYLDNYLSLSLVRDELNYANLLFKKLGIAIIDITNQAIEESASKIINLFCEYKSSHQKM